MVPFMRGASISRYAEVAGELGLDPRAMLRRLDIDPRILEQPELRLPADRIFELLEASAQAAGCESFGLRMAAARRLSDYGAVSLLIVHLPTMRDALMTLVRYQRMLNEALRLDIEDFDDDLSLVRETMISPTGQPQRQAYELAVGTLFHIFRGPLGPTLKPRSVHFTHAPPADGAYHRRFFGPIVEFESEFNGLGCSRVDLDAPSPTADPALALHAERYVATLPYAENASLTAETQKAIQVLLPFNGASIVTVAARLGLSQRTLQRRLAEEEADFSELLNRIRREHALRYLSNVRVPLSQVAALLGYTRETSFARWFATEFGVTPSGWRSASR